MVERSVLAAPRMVWSVAALVHAVADALASRFAVVAVRGELSGFARAASGHCYFNLKDADGGGSAIRCAMFKRAAGMLDFPAADGQLVEVRGRLTVYEPRGELQFVVESMQRAGDGAMLEKFMRLKARLEAEGLFDANRKRDLPPYPRSIGIVTSLGAAVLHDVASSFRRRAPHVNLVVYPSLVQGPDAPAALVRAIQLAARRNEVDVLLLCRGGGSLEDLWAFNDERVVRAIVASPIPVISAVGHETDISLSDFAADLRAPTPTAAAELATPAQQDCRLALQASARLMWRRMHQVLESHQQSLDRAGAGLSRPAEGVRRQSAAVDRWAQRWAAAVRRDGPAREAHLLRQHERARRALDVQLSRHAARLDHLGARLQGSDPKRVLQRGYAWITDAAGLPVQSVRQLSVGGPLKAVLVDGSADARVTAIEARSDD